MSNRLREGLARLTVRLKGRASEEVVYRRGALSATLLVTLGQKLLRIDDGMGGLRLQWTDLDVFVPAADLVAGGIAIPPLRGDTIELTFGDNVEVFEVFPVGSEPPWRWSDPHQSMLRVHVKHIDTRALIP